MGISETNRAGAELGRQRSYREDPGIMKTNSSTDQQHDKPLKTQRTAAIVAKALQDDGYRDALLTNPKRAIQQEFGKELPLGLEVRVVEESANLVYLVLPPKRSVELSDDDLAAVAGGFAAPAQRGNVNGWFPLDEYLATVLM